MICQNCGLAELAPPYPDMDHIEYCSACGYLFRASSYGDPLYTPIFAKWDEGGWYVDSKERKVSWEHVELYRLTHRPLPEE